MARNIPNGWDEGQFLSREEALEEFRELSPSNPLITVFVGEFVRDDDEKIVEVSLENRRGDRIYLVKLLEKGFFSVYNEAQGTREFASYEEALDYAVKLMKQNSNVGQ